MVIETMPNQMLRHSLFLVQGQLNSRWKCKKLSWVAALIPLNPGPLTDAQFNANPKQATRSRNYFNPDIYVPSITLQMKAAKGCYSPYIICNPGEQEIQYSLLALLTNRIPYWPQHFNTKQTGRH